MTRECMDSQCNFAVLHCSGHLGHNCDSSALLSLMTRDDANMTLAHGDDCSSPDDNNVNVLMSDQPLRKTFE